MKANGIGKVSATANFPAPVGGLDAYNSLVAMPPQNAVILRNWYPQAYGCSVRKGYREHQTLAGIAPIESLLVWNSEIDNPATIGVEQQLFAAEGGNIWNISAAGQAPVLLLSGLGADVDTNRWQQINVARAAASYLYCVNGTANPVVITGSTTFQRLVSGNGTTAWTISGVNPATFINCVAYSKMLFFAQKDSSIVWFLPPGTLWGVATSFDCGPYMARGGYIMAMGIWSNDDAITAHEHRIVAVTSGGEAIVFTGDNPADATAWSNIGTYYISPPIGRRCLTKLEADLIVLTQQGLVSLAAASMNNREDLFPQADSTKTQTVLAENLSTYGAMFGWELQTFARATMFIVNMPQATPDANKWLVLNTVTKAWSTFTGMPAYCLGIYYSQPYFALHTTIYEAWTGFLDDVGAAGTGGQAITTEAQQAYNYFDARSQVKHFKMLRPTFIGTQPVPYKAVVDIDFSFTNVYGINNQPVQLASRWNAALWDSGYKWGSDFVVDSLWTTAVGIGYAGSIRIRTQTTADTLWVGTDWVYEIGAII